MPELSRRGFLGTAGLTAAGVALVAVPGVAAVAPELSGVFDDAAAPTADRARASVGTSGGACPRRRGRRALGVERRAEVVIHDPGFVARIVSAAGGHAR